MRPTICCRAEVYRQTDLSLRAKPFASSEVPLLLEQTYVTAPPLLQTYLERLESLVALRKALITDGDHIQCGV
jgi:hypothetical protein